MFIMSFLMFPFHFSLFFMAKLHTRETANKVVTNVCAPIPKKDSGVEILTPSEMVLGDGAFGR